MHLKTLFETNKNGKKKGKKTKSELQKIWICDKNDDKKWRKKSGKKIFSSNKIFLAKSKEKKNKNKT